MFDPFEYRVSRDLRNHLANAFLDTLRDGDRHRFDTRARALKQKAPDPAHRNFADDRIRRYHDLFHALGISAPPAPPRADNFQIAALLLSGDLYFECHEWLEDFWLKASGPEKKAVQALIRTAGAFVLFEAGRRQPAASSAAKACALLQEFRDHIPPPFEADHLLQRLETIPSPE